MKTEKMAFPTGIQDHRGMTLRDYFAAKAMQSYITGAIINKVSIGDEDIAKDAYKMAEVMLTEREK